MGDQNQRVFRANIAGRELLAIKADQSETLDSCNRSRLGRAWWLGPKTSRERRSSQWPQGTRSGWTSTASTVIPTTRAKPSCRSELKGLNMNDAKLHAVIAAAELISPPV